MTEESDEQGGSEEDYQSGYAIDHENIHELQSTAIDYNFRDLPMRSDAPQKWDPRSWWRVEHQGSVGRCAGMAASSAAEIVYYRQSGGKQVQFNGHFSYIEAQRFTPQLFGRDRGSTISSNVRAAKEIGFCKLDWDNDGKEDFKMPSRYSTDIPTEAYAHAAEYKIKTHAYLESFDSILNYLRGGQGGVFVGGPWGNWKPDRRGVCDRFKSGGGGHAWSVLGWDLTHTIVPEDVLLCVNSHGRRSWDQGWAMMTRKFFDEFLAHKHSVAAGISDLTVPRARAIIWQKDLEWV